MIALARSGTTGAGIFFNGSNHFPHTVHLTPLSQTICETEPDLDGTSFGVLLTNGELVL